MIPTPPPTLTTLVTGASASAREEAVARALIPGFVSAIILEGLPSASSALDGCGQEDTNGTGPRLVRIAPGCLCCIGNLVMRVTLNRVLRDRPAQLLISLAKSTHVEQLRRWLSQAPYDQLLTLQADIMTDAVSASE